MMRSSVAVAVLIFSLILPDGSWARSTGAPEFACNRIYPEGHSGTSQDLATSPYDLSISAFTGGEYVPGETYVLTLSGSVDFRGLLVQARTVADDTPVGSFTPQSGTRRACGSQGDQTAITHSNPSLKSSIDLEFTAPPPDTGPIRFLYAVVQVFSGGQSIFYATAETAVLDEEMAVEGPVELSFTGDTPLVILNDIYVNLSVSPVKSLRCELVTRGEPRNPTISRVEDCSSGFVAFLNVPSGEHRVRVIAGDHEAVIRSRVVHMPDDPFFCSLNAINNGITREYFPNGTLSSYTIEFQPIGFDAGFLCQLGYIPELIPCSSPYKIPAETGVTRVKVAPDPQLCPGNRRPLVFRLE